MELWTPCHEDLEDVLPIVLHPADQSVLEVRAPHVGVGLWREGGRERGDGGREGREGRRGREG